MCFVELCAEGGAEGQDKRADAPGNYMSTTSEREGLIHLDVSVTDKTGKLVPGLTADDFTLLDDGRPQELKSFRAEGSKTDAQGKLSEIILLLDEVNLPPMQFAAVKRQAAKFLRDSNGRLNQPVSVFWFSRSGLRATLQPSMDASELATAVARDLPRSRTVWQIPPEDPNALTAPARFVLWRQSLRALYSIAIEQRDKPGRKVLLWMGFGWPASFDRRGEKNRDFYNLSSGMRIGELRRSLL
jgi:VWFA-related protein